VNDGNLNGAPSGARSPAPGWLCQRPHRVLSPLATPEILSYFADCRARFRGKRLSVPAGVARIDGIEKVGLYHVTLFGESWVNVVQDGESVAFCGQMDCSGVRKSVRFQFTRGPAATQPTNSRRQSLTLAVAKAK